MNNSSFQPEDSSTAAKLSAVAQAAVFMTDAELDEFSSMLNRGVAVVKRRRKPLLPVSLFPAAETPKHQVIRRPPYVRIVAATGLVACVCLIAGLSLFRDVPTVPPELQASLVVVAPDGTMLTKDTAETAHFADTVEFRSELTSSRRHRWGLHLNNQEALLLRYSAARSEKSRFDDDLKLDARTCVDFYMVIAADETLPELPADTQIPESGVDVSWLTAICPELQQFGTSEDLRTEVQNRTIEAIREMGYFGPVEVYVWPFFHNGSARQNQL